MLPRAELIEILLPDDAKLALNTCQFSKLYDGDTGHGPGDGEKEIKWDNLNSATRKPAK